MDRRLLLPFALLPLLAAAPADETDDEKIARLEGEQHDLRAEVKSLEIQLTTKKQKLAQRVKGDLPAGTGVFVEGASPTDARFTFTSRHAGKDITGTVDADPPVTGKTAKAKVTATQKGKK